LRSMEEHPTLAWDMGAVGSQRPDSPGFGAFSGVCGYCTVQYRPVLL
jgi:hypothetical protein